LLLGACDASVLAALVTCFQLDGLAISNTAWLTIAMAGCSKSNDDTCKFHGLAHLSLLLQDMFGYKLLHPPKNKLGLDLSVTSRRLRKSSNLLKPVLG
jgi:hypothetical protein